MVTVRVSRLYIAYFGYFYFLFSIFSMFFPFFFFSHLAFMKPPSYVCASYGFGVLFYYINCFSFAFFAFPARYVVMSVVLL